MVVEHVETSNRVKKLINKLDKEEHIDEMTKRCLSLTLNPPRIPQIYTLTNTLKPTPVGRPIIMGYEGPTERISSFVDSLLQPIGKSQKSYLKDKTDFTNFIEKTKVVENAILVSMDVTIAYTQASHRRKKLPLHAKHTKHSIETNLQYLANTSQIY